MSAKTPTAANILSNPYPAERLQDAVRCADAGEWLRPVIVEIAKQCVPQGFRMTIRNQGEWALLVEAVNMGIDAHLEGFTKSTFDASTGRVLVSPDEMGILVDRLRQIVDRLPHCEPNNEENQHESGDCDGEGYCVYGNAETFLFDILDALVRDDDA